MITVKSSLGKPGDAKWRSSGQIFLTHSHIHDAVLYYCHFRELLTNPETNSLYNEGETMRQPKLARTLEIIAEEGPDAFYDGRLSKDVALDIQEQGCMFVWSSAQSPPPADLVILTISLKDLRNEFNFGLSMES